MQALVWIGAALSAIGLAGIIWTVFAVTKAKRAGLGDDALRDRLKKILPVNMGALALSMLGLAIVLVGLLLS